MVMVIILNDDDILVCDNQVFPIDLAEDIRF